MGLGRRLPLPTALRIKLLYQRHEERIEEENDDRIERRDGYGDGERQKGENDAAWCIYMVLRLRIPLYSFATAFCLVRVISYSFWLIPLHASRKEGLDGE